MRLAGKKILIGFLLGFSFYASSFLTASAGGVSPFASDLSYGLTNNTEVVSLQEFLASQKIYAGPITGNFFSLTLAAVKQFQIEHDITPISGYFGPITRTKANALIAASGAVSSGTSAVVPSAGTISSTAPEPSKNPSLVWGAYVGNATSDLSAFEVMVGKPVNIQAYFVGWPNDFPSSTAALLKPAGKTLLIFWESTGYTEAQMTDGSMDSYIASFANQIKAYGGPVIIAPWAEMNGNWSDWGDSVGNNNQTGFITLWRHTHDIFSAVGVPNVKWTWDVNDASVPNLPSNSIAGYYPGDAYVDYVGIDGFNAGNPWESWSEVFPKALIDQLSTYKKPLYILSTGSVPGPEKAQWILDMGAGMGSYPQIAGWVWFNQDGASGDWLVNSDPASLAAFKTIAP